jgi:hypothetical protein
METLEEIYLRTNRLPIITAFQGSIIVEGSTRETKDPESFYKHEVTCFGRTIGELLDNLVAASVTVANDLFAWTTANKSEDYKFGDDYWYIHITHPDILESSISNPKTHDTDTGTGSTLKSAEYVVRFSTLVRDLQIRQAISLLLLETKDTASDIIDKATVPYDTISNVTSFSEMAKCGFTGDELDMILETGEKEGRIKQYLETLNRIRPHRLSSSSYLPDKAKTKWWKKTGR